MDSSSRLPFASHLLQQTLRSICVESQWVYAVFWRILPRNFPPPKWDTDGGFLERSKANKRNWILVWEDGFCDFAACARSAMESRGGAGGSVSAAGFMYSNMESGGSNGLQPELFFKMSHEVYNYGEGLMGKVAADNSHKWVYKDPPKQDTYLLSPWHSTIDPQPRTWEAQFQSGIQTIAIIAVREGVVQLGSTKKIMEDLNLVILLQRKFSHMQNIPGVFLPHPSLQTGSLQLFGGSQESWEWNSRHRRSSTTYDNGSSNSVKTLERCFSWNGSGSDSRPLPWQQESKVSSFPFNRVSSNTFPPSPSPSPLQHAILPPNLPSNSPLGLSPTPIMPSMSSLQALLSRLPSVTSTSSTTIPPPSHSHSHSSHASPSPPIRSLSAPHRGFSHVEAGFAFQLNAAHQASLPEIRHAAEGSRGETSMSGGEVSNMNSGSLDTVAEDAAANTARNSLCTSQNMQFHSSTHECSADDQMKPNMFLDTFENLPDLGLQERLQEGNAYRSYLEDIIDSET